MTDHDATVAAVLAEALMKSDMAHNTFDGFQERRALDGLAALSAAGIRCLYVPEGVAVAHRARLVEHQWSGMCSCHLYAIEATP